MESKRPDTPTVSRTCPNCYYPLPRFGKFCSHCGQKYTDGRVTVGSLLRDFLADTLNLDSKIWRTLAALLVPGKLTKRFFEGKQQRYIKPVRLFFVFAILMVAAVSFFEAEFANDFFLDLDESFTTEVHYADFLKRTSLLVDSLQDAYPEQPTALLDTLQQRLRRGVRDSVSLGASLERTAMGWDLESRKIANQDIATLSTDSLMLRYGVEGFWNQLIFRQNLRLQMRGENFAPFILNQSVWMMLLLMPILAVLLKLLYIRRSYYYVEHLIFSFHTHALVFFLLIVMMLLDSWSPAAPYMERIWGIGFLLMEVYFYLALRRVYGQGRFKTLLKFFLLNLFYFVIFLLALILTIILAALFY